ncbi:MAG TPA: hypothetical protein VM597_28415, partial [Gemmataceae bacterium]|nr:hypothetical protein [Gemmataceae bacterium]
MGNTEIVAAKHYLQVRDEDFTEALKAAPIPVQQGAAPSGIQVSEEGGAESKSPGILGDASPCIA